MFRLRPEDGSWGERRERVESYEPELGESLGDALLHPHRSYWPSLQGVLSQIKGIAHITGGGIAGNLERVLPVGLRAELDAEQWPTPPIFPLIARIGDVSQAEMYRVFNMGLGMAIVVSAEEAETVLAEISEARKIGEVVVEGSSVSSRVAIMSANGLV